jgi:hypothetical protein
MNLPLAVILDKCRFLRQLFLFVAISHDLNSQYSKSISARAGMSVRFFLLQTEFRTRVEGVTVPHTRPDCTILVFHLEATRHLYTTRAHVTPLFVEPIKTFWFFHLSAYHARTLLAEERVVCFIILFFLRLLLHSHLYSASLRRSPT